MDSYWPSKLGYGTGITAEAWISASQATCEPTATKIDKQEFSLSHAHFIEHLLCMTENPLRQHSERLGKLEPWNWWLKNKTSFHRREPSQNRESKTEEGRCLHCFYWWTELRARSILEEEDDRWFCLAARKSLRKTGAGGRAKTEENSAARSTDEEQNQHENKDLDTGNGGEKIKLRLGALLMGGCSHDEERVQTQGCDQNQKPWRQNEIRCAGSEKWDRSWKHRPWLARRKLVIETKNRGDTRTGRRCSDTRTGRRASLARRKPNRIWPVDWQSETKHRNAWEQSLVTAKMMGNRSHSTSKNEYEEHC
jgi:hypothetical protein